MTHKEVQQRKHERNFIWLWNYLSERQCKCGEKDIRVLDLHHREPKRKSFTITAELWNSSLERLKAEASKCDVLCKNCHAREHNTRLNHAISYGLLSPEAAEMYEGISNPG